LAWFTCQTHTRLATPTIVIAAGAGALLLSPRRMISFVRYWVPPLLWMLVIFGASADPKSTEHTSRFLEPFLRWLNPNISAAAIDHVRWLVRKAAHLTEFALLAWLWWRALRKPKRHDARPWSWKQAALALAVVISYAAIDEFHQRFVPGRTGSIKDVGIDTAGGTLGIIVLRLSHGRRKRTEPE
jgi:VanZ family protein